MNCLRLLPLLFLSTSLLKADLVIVQDIDGMGQKMTMTMKTKGSLLRIDMNPQMSVIMDGTTGDMKTLMHDQKMYMSMNINAMKGMIEATTKSAAPADGGGTKPTIKALGNKEKIDGYDTEEYLVTQGNVVSHTWIAKDYPHFKAFIAAMETMRQGPIGKMSPQLQMDMSQLPGMPLKSVVEMNGKPTATSIVKSVEEKELAASDFTAPADYKTIAMPQAPGAPQPGTDQ
jgi:hypothetical protein